MAEIFFFWYLESVYKDDLIQNLSEICVFCSYCGLGTATNLNKQLHRSLFSCGIVFSVDKSLTSLAQLKQMIREEVALILPEMVRQAVYSTRKRTSSWLCARGRSLRRGRRGVVSNCESAETSIMIS